jgi:hypothetical protein
MPGLSNRARIGGSGKGRAQAREPSELSFHSLKHSAVRMLKASGVSDFIAREIIGHGNSGRAGELAKVGRASP